MITRNSSEEEILKELVMDYKWAKAYMAKDVKKILEKEHKKGGARPGHSIMQYKTSPRGNKWYLHADFLPKGKAEWQFRGICRVDNTATGMPDHYILRGIRIEKPFYVKLTGHCIKRMRQRLGKLNPTIKEYQDSSVAALAIQPREIPTFAQSGPSISGRLRLLKNRNMIDSLIFYCQAGFFLGCHTPKANFILNTFITPDMTWGQMQQLSLLSPMLVYYNINKEQFGHLPFMKGIKENFSELLESEYGQTGDLAHVLAF